MSAWRAWRMAPGADVDGGPQVYTSVLDGAVVVRDSKHAPIGACLTFTREQWAAFLAAVKRGEFDDE